MDEHREDRLISDLTGIKFVKPGELAFILIRSDDEYELATTPTDRDIRDIAKRWDLDLGRIRRAILQMSSDAYGLMIDVPIFTGGE